jgi:hypothetical protein
MSETPDLRPATPEEIAQTLSFALHYDGRKGVYHADDIMTRIAVERLVRHLERSGFVVMKKPPVQMLSTSRMPSSRRSAEAWAGGQLDAEPGVIPIPPPEGST